VEGLSIMQFVIVWVICCDHRCCWSCVFADNKFFINFMQTLDILTL